MLLYQEWPSNVFFRTGLRLLSPKIALYVSLFVLLSFCPFSIGHCIVCPSSVYGYFWFPFGIFWTFYCLSFIGLRLFLITLWYLLDIALSVILRFTAISDYPLVTFGHCIVCHSSLYGYFWLPFGIFWPLHCLSFFGLRLLLITLWYLLAIVLSVILRFTATSDYPLVSFDHCIVCHSYIRVRASHYPLVSFGHCIVCPSV